MVGFSGASYIFCQFGSTDPRFVGKWAAIVVKSSIAAHSRHIFTAQGTRVDAQHYAVTGGFVYTPEIWPMLHGANIIV